MIYGDKYKFEPLSNDEALKWVKAHFGSSFIKTVSRTKYTAKILCRGEDGNKEVVVSLPRILH